MSHSDYSDVFISYRRKNKEFAKQLNDAIRETGREVWIDWEDIPPGSVDFNDDIYRGIRGADAFIAILSPDYLDSEYTLGELEYAAKLHKRLIPVVMKKFEDERTPPSISHINWIYFTPHIDEQNDFDDAFGRLITALESDLAHTRFHTRFLIRAQEWNDNKRDESFLLHGNELLDAESWLANAGEKLPSPTQLHTEHIFASRARSRSRQQALLARVTVIMLFAVALAILSLFLYQRALQSEREAIRQQNRAVRSAAEANSLNLASAARQILTRDPVLALSLAMESVGITNPPGGAQRILAEVAFSPGAVRRLVGHTEPVTDVAFSHDGQRVASVAEDGRLLVWNFASGEILQDMRYGHDSNRLTSVAYSPDDAYLLTGGADSNIILWDAETGESIQTFSEHSVGVTSVAFNPVEPNIFASGSHDQNIIIWDRQSGDVIGTLTGHTNQISDIAFSVDGQTLLSGSWDDTLILWNVDSSSEEFGEPIHVFEGHRDYVASVAFSPDNKSAISGGGDDLVILWNLADGSRLRVFEAHDDSVTSVDHSPTRKEAISASADNLLRVWDVRTGSLIFQFTNPSEEDTDDLEDTMVDVVRYSPSGDVIITGDNNGDLILWRVVQEMDIDLPERAFRGHNDWVMDVDFHPTLERSISGSRDGSLLMWNTDEEDSVIDRIDGHNQQVNRVQFIDGGDRAITASDDGTLHIWDVDPESEDFGLPLYIIQAHDDWVRGLDVSADETRAITGSAGGVLTYWDIDPASADFGQRIWSVQAHENIINNAHFNADDTQVATASYDGTARLWRTSDGGLLNTFTGHTAAVRDVDFNPAGNRLATGSDDSTVIIWDVETGQVLREFNGHGDMVRRVIFSPDGNMLLSASADELLILWTVETGESLRIFSGHEDAVMSATFRDDGDFALSASADQQLLMWPINTLDELREWVDTNRFQRPLTCRERDFYGVTPPCNEDGIVPEV
jgi:WD40 repeat protein